METESYPSAKLANLDFETDNETEMFSISRIPLPDELPRQTDYSHLPKDILKSSTVEGLISQNEDLMARLKVSLRRLSLLELENQKLSEETQRARTAQASVGDQILIWKEKDGMWKQKIDQLEREKEIQGEKLKALNSKVLNMTADLNRHVKYHERIKTQVKPYISELKQYAETQDIKIQQLENSLAKKEGQMRDLRHQIIEVTKNSRYQVEVSEKKAQDLVHFYEGQVQNLTQEVAQLNQIQQELEAKSLKLHTALEQQDILENQLVTLRRSKDELRDRLSEEMGRQQERVSELTRQNQKLGVEHADLQIRVVEDQEKVQRLEKENFQLKEQLESLRYMWNAKNDEHEKLKAAASALERLNLELSQKLNSQRRE